SSRVLQANFWSIVDFLNESVEEPFKNKIDRYLKSLETIMNSEQGKRANRAKVLYDSYKKASKSFLFEIVAWRRISLYPLGTDGTASLADVPKSRADCTKAKEWEEKRTKKQVHIHQPNLNVGVVINEINGGTFGSINNENKESKEQANFKRDEVDVFFQSPSQTKCNDDDNSRKMMSVYDYKKYEKSYAKLDDSKKWVLTTGTVVEDALYKFGLRCKYEHLAHSFVLDPDDHTYLKENIFTESELREIRHFQVKETPLMPLDLIKYLNSFNLKTSSEIRKQIFSPDQMDQDFNRSRDFDRDWIRNTNMNRNTLTTDHLELWLLVHVWSFTDKVFNDIEEVKVVRGESCSLLSSARKNRERTVPGIADIERKALGMRGDMIIRKITAEFGCAEVGRQFESENGTKLLRERGLKMPKMMKDMFNRLCETFNHDDHKTRQLEMIGFLHAGLMMVLLRLDSPAGYVCRVLRSKSFSIATNIKEFGKTLPLISLTWKANKIVENMISLIEKTDETDESSEEDQLRRLQDIYDITPLPSRKRKKVDLPTCLDTPSKLSKRAKKSHLICLDHHHHSTVIKQESCPDPQCEGENSVTAKFCSDCGKPINE
ncbi:1540_t:CDS:10, partial [Acaulospora morrowiae]